MVDEHLAYGEEYDFNNIELARENFIAFVRKLEEEAAGIGLPLGLAPPGFIKRSLSQVCPAYFF